MRRRPLLIAIDGPAGAGKSAAARELARRLRIPYLDTGAMYRAVALLALRAGMVSPFDRSAQLGLVDIARSMRFGFRESDAGQRIELEGEDVTDALRDPRVSQLASEVSSISAVRRELVARQRSLAADSGGVVEGRDIGTVVFPDADVKVFLTAAPETRAQRRFEELRRRGVTVTREAVSAEQRERDLRDSTREDSPLVPAPGAVLVDTTRLDLDDVIQALLDVVSAAVDSQRKRSL